MKTIKAVKKQVTPKKKIAAKKTAPRKKYQRSVDKALQDLAASTAITMTQPQGRKFSWPEDGMLETLKEIKTLLKEIRTSVKCQPQLEGLKSYTLTLAQNTTRTYLLLEKTIAERMNNLIVQNNETHRLLKILIELWK
ncbi:MAG: hypothetical protein ACM3QX_18385 [Syntrophomonadaceae bacterium]